MQERRRRLLQRLVRRLPPFTFDELRTSIVLKHEATTIDGFVILAPSPIRINRFVLSASAALFDVEVIAFIIQVDRSAAAVAPYHREMATINVESHCVPRLPNHRSLPPAQRGRN